MTARKETLNDLGFQPHDGYVDPDDRVLVNDERQILPDLVATSEAWLWESPALRASMERALKQAEKGEFEELGTFSQHANGEE